MRVGFPTAEVHVYVNRVGLEQDQYNACFIAHAARADFVRLVDERVHLADWIRGCVESCSDEDGPLVTLDGDVHFWKSCEGWTFPNLLAGYYVPEIFNDWAQCKSVARLHTSFLWFSRPRAMLEKLKQVYRWNGEYCPCDPFMGRVMFKEGRPVFWDVCANLFHMIGGDRFGDEHTACYEHLNSAGFVEEMAERLGGKTGEDFKLFHALAPKDPELVRTLSWPLVKRYYRKKEIEAQVVDRMGKPG